MASSADEEKAKQYWMEAEKKLKSSNSFMSSIFKFVFNLILIL
jgi:hypothetical protein